MMKRLILFLFLLPVVSAVEPIPNIFVPYTGPGTQFTCNSYIKANVTLANALVAEYDSLFPANNNMSVIACAESLPGLIEITFQPDNPLMPGNYIFSTIGKAVGEWGISSSASFTVDPYTLNLDLTKPTCTIGNSQNCVLDAASFNAAQSTTSWRSNCKYRFNQSQPYQDFTQTGGKIHNLTGAFTVPATLQINCTDNFFGSQASAEFNFYDFYKVELENPECTNPLDCILPAGTTFFNISTSISSNCRYDVTNDIAIDPVGFISMNSFVYSDGFTHTSQNNIQIIADQYKVIHVNCSVPVSASHVMTKYILEGPLFLPFDHDRSQADCSTLANYKGQCSATNTENCWNNDLTPSPLEDHGCCGDDTDECWLDNRDLGCCYSNEENKLAYILDPDQSQGLCNKLGIKYFGQSFGPCDQDDTYCWAADCCGDDTSEDWSYQTSTTLSEILVDASCANAVWKKRDQSLLTYYSISIQ